MTEDGKVNLSWHGTAGGIVMSSTMFLLLVVAVLEGETAHMKMFSLSFLVGLFMFWAGYWRGKYEP